jgi:hypothetical protein
LSRGASHTSKRETRVMSFRSSYEHCYTKTTIQLKQFKKPTTRSRNEQGRRETGNGGASFELDIHQHLLETSLVYGEMQREEMDKARVSRHGHKVVDKFRPRRGVQRVPIPRREAVDAVMASGVWVALCEEHILQSVQLARS